jgi:hypothetical protein
MAHQIYWEPWRLAGCGALLEGELEAPPDPLELLPAGLPAGTEFDRASACCK